MIDALIDAYGPERIDRSFNERVMELYAAGTLGREDVERLLNGPEVKREPRRTMMTERQLLDVIDRAIAEFRHVEGTYDGVHWMQLDREHDVASFALIRLGRPIRDPGPPRHLCECGWPLERYFDQTLPCVTCSTQENATVMVGRGQPPGALYYLSLQLIFRRNPEAKRWDPQPCIDRYVDTRLTEMLEDAGLGRALMPIEPVDFPAPPPSLHDYVEHLKKEAANAFAHVPVETGRKIGSMESFQQRDTFRTWTEVPVSPYLVEVAGAQRDFKHQFTPSRLRRAHLRGYQHCYHCGDISIADTDAVEDCWKRVRKSAFGTCRPVEGSHDRKTWVQLDGMPTRETPFRYLRLGGQPLAPAPAVPAKQPSSVHPEPDPPVALLCHLGLTCPIHYPKKVEPYVPTVTDWDLLPDVVPDALRVRR